MVLFNLTRISSEPAIVTDTIILLVALVETKEKCEQVVSRPGLGQLPQLSVTKDKGALPTSAKRGLVKALVLVGVGQD